MLTYAHRDTDEAIAELDIAEAVDEAALAQGVRLYRGCHASQQVLCCHAEHLETYVYCTLHAQAVTVLQEIVSESTGERTQIIFRRDAEISPADLLELIDKVWLRAVAITP